MLEAIEKMKANRQASQTSVKPAPAPKPAKVEQVEAVEDEEDDYVDEEEDEVIETPVVAKKVAPKPQKQEIVEEKQEIPTEEEQIAMQIELLQNDGRFRVELLHQLQEINKALVVMAGVLMDLAGGNEKA